MKTKNAHYDELFKAKYSGGSQELMTFKECNYINRDIKIIFHR